MTRQAAIVVANKTARAEFAAKILPIVKEIRSVGVKTHQGICDGRD